MKAITGELQSSLEVGVIDRKKARNVVRKARTEGRMICLLKDVTVKRHL